MPGMVKDPVRAALLGIASSTAYSVTSVLVRLLAERGLHVFELAFLRSALALAVLSMLSKVLGSGGWATQRAPILLLRGALSSAGLLLWFYGLVHLPLADALALSQT